MPRPARSFQTMVLYAGEVGWADFHQCFLQLTFDFNAVDTFPFTISLQIIEVDLLRGGSNLELVEPGVRTRLLSTCCSPSSVVVAVPAYRSFSRRRHLEIKGPRALRDKFWPRGKPGLTALEQRCVGNENLIADFLIEVVGAVARTSPVLFACPEDLGSTARGWPACLWQWP